MGLGPPVCNWCEVIAVPTPEHDHRYGVKGKLGDCTTPYYHCPKCGTVKLRASLWEFSMGRQAEIQSNSRQYHKWFDWREMIRRASN